MKFTYQLLALNASEVQELLTKHPHFNRLRPTKCDGCGDAGPFERRIFRISGVRQSQHTDDNVQGALRSYLYRQYGIDYVFFRSAEDKFYADSAICSKCGSSKIVFDVELTDEVLADIARLTGRNISEVKSGIKKAGRLIRM